MSQRIYPIGVQNFEKVRKDGYFYVDKTALIHQLVTTGCYYFLSRPRRFGKSLLISTLQAYFEGKRELFTGLAMEKLEQKWTVHPVLHLDLNIEKYDSVESLENILESNLSRWEGIYGANPSDRSFSLRFAGIIRRACEQTGQRVVVLVDEYDKPLLQSIGNKEVQTELRNMLKPFYGVLKTMDECIRFALLTGVTKFGKVSVFSDLNNLMDITMDNRYSEICGISEQELHTFFKEDIEELAIRQQTTVADITEKLRLRYDGYHFCPDTGGMYNPFSLLNTFARMKFGSYWFETGTPTYLVELLRNNDYNLEEVNGAVATEDMLSGVDTADTDPIPVIFQSGYLTIKGYDPEFGIYTLGYPNKEVEEGFIRFLAPAYTAMPNEGKSVFAIQNFIREVRTGDIDGFFTRLRSFFSDTTYELVRQQELHYSNVLYIVFRLMGFYTQVEYHTSNGRIDLVLQTADYIYVMEFKLNGTAEEALQQINDKGYALPFEKDPRTLYKIGVNFSPETRNIDKWVVEISPVIV
ncbi:MAG: ATP-binding protein [Bacteroidaceae bacterium]|nr:ATP-binding protein [Bacteroidaceae bacterium]